MFFTGEVSDGQKQRFNDLNETLKEAFGVEIFEAGVPEGTDHEFFTLRKGDQYVRLETRSAKGEGSWLIEKKQKPTATT